MAGPRFVDWSHIRVVGDRHAAAPYVNEARKLMGYVQEDAARQGLGVHSLRRELSDGTVIIAEKHGEVPRMTIIPVGEGGERRPVLMEGFVVNRTNAVDPVILRHPEDEGWVPYFHTSNSPGYDEVDEDLRRTYLGAYPQGLAHQGGAVCWWNERGEFLNIWNAGSRYIAPAAYHPYTIFGGFVLHRGEQCLDLIEYRTAGGGSFAGTTPHILGAAFKDGWLYVMMGGLSTLLYTQPPTTPSTMTDVWMSNLFSGSTFNYALRRFKLTPALNPVTGNAYYKVLHGSDETLSAFTGTRTYSPWVFNEDVTEVVTYTLPASVTLMHRTLTGGDYGPFEEPEPPEFTGLTATTTWRISIAINGGDPTAPVTTDAGNAIAEDNGVVLELVPTYAGGYQYVCDGKTYPAVDFSGGDNSTIGATYTNCWLIDCDIKADVFVFVENVTTTIPHANNPDQAPLAVYSRRERRLMVYRGGALEYAGPVATTFGWIDYDGCVRGSEQAWSLGVSGMHRLTMRMARSRVHSRGLDSEDVPMLVYSHGMNETVNLRHSRFTFPVTARYSVTGGALTAWPQVIPSDPPQLNLFFEQYGYGYNNALDPYNSINANAVVALNGLAVNGPDVVCYASDDSDTTVYCTNNPLGGEALVGHTTAPAVIGVLGRPPLEQKYVVETP